MLLALTLVSMLAWLLPATAQAQSCWINGAAGLDFGEVTASGNTDAQSSLGFQCQSGNGSAVFTVCVFVGEGTPTGLAPRRMTNSNGAFMNYDLYSNAARTDRIGPLGSSDPVYALSLRITGSFNTLSSAFTLFGRVPANQNLPAAFPYLGLPAGSVMRFSYGNGSQPPSAADCRNGVPGNQGGAGEMPFAWSGVRATYANTCQLVIATDVDFGTASTLPGNRDQTSTIQLQCATSTAWRIGLDNGINSMGGIRRMASNTNRIAYELYRDPARLQRWSNTSPNDASGSGSGTVQALTVYGRVPAQATPAAGTYADTITVTLTY